VSCNHRLHFNPHAEGLRCPECYEVVQMKPDFKFGQVASWMRLHSYVEARRLQDRARIYKELGIVLDNRQIVRADVGIEGRRHEICFNLGA
jgi:hypothetical protein